MLAVPRSRAVHSTFSQALQLWKMRFSGSNYSSSSSAVNGFSKGLLDLQEIEKVLSDVRADDVKVIPVPKHCDWADFMVLATGRSTWHVKNIAQALIYKAGLFVPFLNLLSVLDVKFLYELQYCYCPRRNFSSRIQMQARIGRKKT